MSGIASIFREWLSIFYPSAANPRGLFDASLITCFFSAAVFVFARQRSIISSLETTQQRDETKRHKLRKIREQLGDFMNEGETLTREWRAGLRDYGIWLDKRRKWVERASDCLVNLGLPDEAAAFRHSLESDPKIEQLQGNKTLAK